MARYGKICLECQVKGCLLTNSAHVNESFYTVCTIWLVNNEALLKELSKV